MNKDGGELEWFSEDKKGLAVNEMVLYEYTHTNEGGIMEYQVVAITNRDAEADKFLNYEKYTAVKVHAGEGSESESE